MEAELHFVYISFRFCLHSHSIPTDSLGFNERMNYNEQIQRTIQEREKKITKTFARLQMQIMHEQRFLSIVCSTLNMYQHLAFAKSFHINIVIFNAFSFICNSILWMPYFISFFSLVVHYICTQHLLRWMDVVQTPFISALNISLLKLIKNYDWCGVKAR